MSNLTFECLDCGRMGDAPADSNRARQQVCFRCSVSTIGMTFRGAAGGRKSFHEDTIAGLQREAHEAARESGREIRPKNKVNGAFM